jgi:RecA/RadA recombinase
MLTDIYGESGSGKSQLCFNLSANCAKSGFKVVYIDTAGTFRPERVIQIAGSSAVLEKIIVLRALTTLDQKNSIEKILDFCPRLVIVDTLTALFSAEYSGPVRHLQVMKHLHELALIAITSGSAVVVTNMIRNAPINIVDQAGRNVAQAVVPSEQREFLGSSVSIYTHIKLKLEIVNAAKSIFRAILIQPVGKIPAYYSIRGSGITDTN